MGNLALGFTSPKRMLATASAPLLPAYHASRTALTLSSQGMETAEPLSSTTTVFGFAAAVSMPWLDKVSAVLEAWYAGSKGAEAVANILFGDVNPSAKLPMTFPRSEADLPRPH